MRLLLCVLLLALSGCTSLETATITITGGGMAIEDDQSFDPESTPTAHLYEAQGKDHAGSYTAHDLLFEWAQQHGHGLETQFFDADFGYGFTLCAINDYPPAEFNGNTRGCFERDGFWALSINGEAAQVGMGQLEVGDNDTVAFTWTPSQAAD